MPKFLERMNAEEIEKLSRATTVFFFSVGPIEDHGSHLPVSLDLCEADRLCVLSAEALEKAMPLYVGVIMPKAALGINSNTTRFALTVRAHVLRDWLVDACLSLSRAGFQTFVCWSGNIGPHQLTAIEDAGKIVRRKTGGGPIGSLKSFFTFAITRKWLISARLISAASPLVTREQIRSSWFFPNPKEHGGALDTSVALAIVPQWVDPHFSVLDPIERPASLLERLKKRHLRTLAGYWGNPAQGSSEKGKQYLEERVQEFMPKLRAVLEGSNPEVLFRSWYSLIPTNKSFFLAWLIAVSIITLMVIWFYGVTAAFSFGGL